MTLYELAFQPFADYSFMRRALAACAALSLGGAPLGVFLVLRRMALMGDAMSHAILPGVSLAFLLFGLSLWPMTLGGLLAGLIVTLIAGAISRLTPLKEDASFTGAYMLSLAAGVIIISLRGTTIDLMHVLFGNVLAVDRQALLMIGAIASFSVMALALLYRSLILECFDPGYGRSLHAHGALVHQLFLMLIVLNLVSAFQALGTLMSLGLMLLPAIASRFWCRQVGGMLGLSVAISLSSSVIGLLLSYHHNLPSGPAIILTSGGVYVFSLLFGIHSGLLQRYFPRKHYAH